MMYDKQKVIDIALAEVGYLEKETTSQLDNPTANAGDNNRTKYARDLDSLKFYNGRKQGAAWCDVFVDWCFVQAYGLEAALKLTCQPSNNASNCGAGCKWSRQYYEKKRQLYTTPEVGDQIFFYSKDKSSISHTGLVYAVDDKKIYTVEGNTSGRNGVIANGGGVCKKSYSLTYARLAGFGRPDWSMPVASEPNKDKTVKSSYTAKSFIEDVQKAFGVKVDGIAGPETLSKTVTISAKRNRKHPAVKPIQKRLAALGYSEVGKADGIAGPFFTEAVKHYQADNDCVIDGVISAKKKTYRKLLGME